MLLTKALWCGAAVLLPVLGLLYYLLSDIQRPTVMRPATATEKRQTTQAVTGWGKAFATHR